MEYAICERLGISHHEFQAFPLVDKRAWLMFNLVKGKKEQRAREHAERTAKARKNAPKLRGR